MPVGLVAYNLALETLIPFLAIGIAGFTPEKSAPETE
jgi:hypothetical protein